MGLHRKCQKLRMISFIKQQWNYESFRRLNYFIWALGTVGIATGMNFWFAVGIVSFNLFVWLLAYIFRNNP